MDAWTVEALLAQWLERAAVNRKVTGSIPVRSVFLNLRLARAANMSVHVFYGEVST